LTTHNASSAEVKERVELYLYLHFWDLVACYMVNFTYSRDVRCTDVDWSKQVQGTVG